MWCFSSLVGKLVDLMTGRGKEERREEEGGEGARGRIGGGVRVREEEEGGGVTQEQKAENTGRQFCSCFYQLLGISRVQARRQDASWGVRVGTYVSLANISSSLSKYCLRLPFFLSSLSLFSFFLLSHSFFSIILFLLVSSTLPWLPLCSSFFFRSPFASYSDLFFFISSFLSFFLSYSLSLRLGCTGHWGHPPRCIATCCPIFTHGKSTLKR